MGFAVIAADRASHPPLTLPLSHTPAADEEAFNDLLSTYFPNVYDVKCLVAARESDALPRGGLQALADALKVARVGTAHQAGSDSALTAGTFFKLRKDYFGGRIDDRHFRGALFGFSLKV
jgi:CCR4-NOT transcription complex subunit 7/8